jgi:SAM-dependent methyltransferase
VTDRAQHWDAAYSQKGEAGVSWFEESPAFSIELIERFIPAQNPSVIDVGGGASRLVDAGLQRGWSMAVLDISEQAIEAARARLLASADRVEWIVADVTMWQPHGGYDIWHDRAAFHFLTDRKDRQAYVERLRIGLKPGGHAVIASFALDGPERCSGLPVERYDADKLLDSLGKGFGLIETHGLFHRTPWGTEQSFQYTVFQRDQA